MDVTRISADLVSRLSIEMLGLDPDYVDFTFPEVIAEAVRRIVSIRGPISRSSAARLVLEPLQGLPGIDGTIGELTSDVIEQLLSVGDLVENVADGASPGTGLLMFITMPRFVKISTQLLVLLGGRPDGVPPLSAELAPYLDRNGSVRYLRLPEASADEVLTQLHDEGVREIRSEHWLRSPHPEPPAEYLQRISNRVDAATTPGELDGALLFDPSTARGHYRSRWRPLSQPADGLTILRRPQAYGADRWSVGRARDGYLLQLVDLPVDAGGDRACDEAWRIMAALDALQGTPPEIRPVPLSGGRVRLDLDAPPPAWLQRHLAFFGFPVARAKGALLSFSVEEQAIGHLRELVAERLWPAWIEKVNEHE